MNELYRKELRKVRAIGIDVFVLPTADQPEGMAFLSGHTAHCRKFHINVFGETTSPLWLFVLFHEVAHHLLRHTLRWTSEPAWITEKAADDFALRMIRVVQPEAFELCEQIAG